MFASLSFYVHAACAHMRTRQKSRNLVLYRNTNTPRPAICETNKREYTVTVKGYKKTSKTIKKLKAKKKYYVHVRTYKKVGTVKYYSSWSKTKSVKTK